MNINITEEAKIIFGCLLDDKGAKLPYGYKKIYAEDIKYILTSKRKNKWEN